MKYEEIKIGDVFRCEGYEETVISKSDEYRIITTIDCGTVPTSWKEDDLCLIELIEEELPKEGLLVGKSGSLVYKLSDGSAYGFGLGKQSNYRFYENKRIILNGHWKPATKEQEVKFIEMLKKECEKHGLFKSTKIEDHADIRDCDLLNKFSFEVAADAEQLWNIHGQIFYKGKFATPLKEETTLELVAKAVKEIGDFTIEQTESGVIILTPIS